MLVVNFAIYSVSQYVDNRPVKLDAMNIQLMRSLYANSNPNDFQYSDHSEFFFKIMFLVLYKMTQTLYFRIPGQSLYIP